MTLSARFLLFVVAVLACTGCAGFAGTRGDAAQSVTVIVRSEAFNDARIYARSWGGAGRRLGIAYGNRQTVFENVRWSSNTITLVADYIGGGRNTHTERLALPGGGHTVITLWLTSTREYHYSIRTF